MKTFSAMLLILPMQSWKTTFLKERFSRTHKSVSVDEGLLQLEPEIHVVLCRKMSCWLNWAAACCPIPRFHLITHLAKLSADTEREWYTAQVIQHGWSRPTVDVHIKNQLHLHQGVAITNFNCHLPTPHAQLAIDALKAPYLFDFLGLGDRAHERDIENALIRHITRFLLELGAGFAFFRRQFRLEVV